MSLIHRNTLGLVLRCQPSTLQKFHERGVLVRDVPDGYTTTRVNEFLASVAFYFEPALRWDDLRTGRVRLLSAQEVRSQYGFSKAELRVLRGRRKVPHLQIPTADNQLQYRYTAASMQQCVDQPKIQMPLAWLAGYTDSATFRAVLGVGPNRSVKATALMQYLREAVSPSVTPENWIAECRAAKRPPLHPAEIAQRMGMELGPTIDALLQNGVPFVRLPTADDVGMRFSPLWAEAPTEKYKECTAKDVARLFDVSPWTVRGWRLDNTCPLGHSHVQLESGWLAICWLAYLTDDVVPGDAYRMYHFWASRLIYGDASPLLGTKALADAWGVSAMHINTMATAGELPSVRTPGKVFRFLPAWIEEVQASR